MYISEICKETNIEGLCMSISIGSLLSGVRKYFSCPERSNSKNWYRMSYTVRAVSAVSLCLMTGVSCKLAVCGFVFQAIVIYNTISKGFFDKLLFKQFSLVFSVAGSFLSIFAGSYLLGYDRVFVVTSYTLWLLSVFMERMLPCIANKIRVGGKNSSTVVSIICRLTSFWLGILLLYRFISLGL